MKIRCDGFKVQLRNVLPFLLAIVLAISSPPPSIAEPVPCDPELEARAGDELGYRLRGERCEGRYAHEDVASTTLNLISFLATSAVAHGETWQAAALNVGWTAPPAVDSVHLRAQGLRSRLRYRMDANRPARATPFTWVTDLLSALQILPNEVGLVAWARQSLGGEAHEVYLPLTVKPSGPAVRGSYQLVVRPGRELSEIYLSLTPLGKDGAPGKPLKDGEPLGFNYYPAGHGTEIILPALAVAGFYHLELGATLKGGGVATLELVFYHPG